MGANQENLAIILLERMASADVTRLVGVACGGRMAEKSFVCHLCQ